MKVLPIKKRAFDLLHRGVIALAEVEGNGIRMDTEYLDQAIVDTEKKMKAITAELKESEVAKIWKRMFGRKMNFGSTDQLGKVLYDGMGYETDHMTEAGNYKVDETALSAIDHPFIGKYLQLKKLDKACGTYLKGLKREIVNGYIHPSFNLHFVKTYRSSSDSPNFQNIPIRNPEIGKLVRTAFVSRPGHHLVELDYSGIEVSIAACYHKDPVMYEYICDPAKDMHRDMAMECFCLDEDEMRNPVDKEDGKRIKTIRYCGKNMFVFPQFYGDWYISNAKALWEAIDTMKLTTRDGTCMRDYLVTQGITKLGDCDPQQKPRRNTFEKHLQEVEQSFWNDRFSVYGQWKKDWYEKYRKRGWFPMKTGFVCQGFLKRNEVINYPVQGAAFHCLLKSMTTLVLDEIPKRKMKTKIVGQIHDSIIADVPEEELQDYLALANQVMTKDLLEEWKWIIIPLEIEAEVCPLNGCWADKEEVPLP